MQRISLRWASKWSLSSVKNFPLQMLSGILKSTALKVPKLRPIFLLTTVNRLEE
jgi:hypothetical protein